MFFRNAMRCDDTFAAVILRISYHFVKKRIERDLVSYEKVLEATYKILSNETTEIGGKE